MSNPIDDERPLFTPSNRVAGDWSAHIATTLDRTATALGALEPEQWEAPSLCEGWRVRDVVGHLVWRLGEPTGGLMRSMSRAYFGRHVMPDRAIADLARAEAEASNDELIGKLRRIAANKVYKRGRTGITELTEAVVHTVDISEAIDAPFPVSPRSTSAVAIARIRVPLSHAARVASGHALIATDARWKIGDGAPVEATASRLIAALFGRLPLPDAR